MRIRIAFRADFVRTALDAVGQRRAARLTRFSVSRVNEEGGQTKHAHRCIRRALHAVRQSRLAKRTVPSVEPVQRVVAGRTAAGRRGCAALAVAEQYVARRAYASARLKVGNARQASRHVRAGQT